MKKLQISSAEEEQLLAAMRGWPGVARAMDDAAHDMAVFGQSVVRVSMSNTTGELSYIACSPQAVVIEGGTK